MNGYRKTINRCAYIFILLSLTFSQSYAITIDMGAMRRKARSSESNMKKSEKDIKTSLLNVKVHRLKNGFNVYLVPKRDGSGNAAVFLWIRAGASDEPEDLFGVAHVLEHLVFKGSPERGITEVSDAIERVGGYINAWTSYDNTVYWSVIPSEHIMIPLEVLRDIVWFPSFSDEDFETEKDVVLEEWRRGQDIPYYRLIQRFFSEIYRNHPYGHPVIGYESTIKKITRDDVMRFHTSFYSPENSYLVVSGDFDEEEVLSAAKKLFEKIGRKRDGVRLSKKDVKKELDFRGPTSFIITGKEKEAHVIIGFVGFPYSASYAVYLDVISEILEKRLLKKLRIENMVVNSINVDYWSPVGVGLFEIFFSAKGEKIKEAFDTIYRELIKLRTTGVFEEELYSARNSVLSDFYKNFQTVSSIASLVGYSVQLEGRPDSPLIHLDILHRITKEKIHEFAQAVLDESRFLVGIYVNEEDVKYLDGFDVSSVTLKKEFRLPFSLVEEKLGVKKYISENGIRVLLKKIEGTGTISVVSVFPGGNVFYSDGAGIPNLAAGVLTRGTRSKSAEMILEEISSIGGTISASAGFDAFAISSSFLRNKYERGFQIFFDVLLNPAFDEKEIEKVRQDILEDLRTRYDNPQVQAVDEFMKMLFEGTTYSLPDGISENNVKTASREDLVKFWEYVTSDPEKIVLGVVGDIGDESEILKAFYFYGYELFTRGKKADIRFPDKVSCVSQDLERRIRRDGNQMHILIGLCGPSLLDKENIFFQLIAASVSGMGGRFFMNLREKKGLAYVVAPIRRSFISAGIFGGYIASAPEKLEEALRSLRNEIQNIVNLSLEEFERGKNVVLGSIRRELQSNSQWAWTLTQDEFLGRGFDYYHKVQKDIKNASLEDALSSLRRYLETSKFSILILGPFSDEENK